MSFSTSMQKTANKLLAKYGNNISIVHQTNCIYDPTIGHITCDETLYPYMASLSAYSSQELQSEYISVDDLKATIQTDMNLKNKATNENFEIEYGGRWQIINVEVITSQDNIIIQKLQIRGVV